jgi:hypothetical protein
MDTYSLCKCDSFWAIGSPKTLRLSKGSRAFRKCDQYVCYDIFNYCDIDTKLILVCLNKTFRRNNRYIQKNKLFNQRINLYSDDLSQRAFKYSLKPLNWKHIFLQVCDIKNKKITELIKILLNYGKRVYEHLKVTQPRKVERYWKNKIIFKYGIYSLTHHIKFYDSNEGTTDDLSHDVEVLMIKDFMKENNIVE